MSGLPATIDPVQLAERGIRLQGTLPVKGMPRLAQACLDDRGEVEVDLEFRRSESGDLLEMAGRLRANLFVQCQRCLEPMRLEVEAQPQLVLLRGGEGEDLRAAESDTLVAEKPVSLSGLVEDELILVLPMFPAHPPGQCPAPEPDATASARTNPFAVLRELRKTGR